MKTRKSYNAFICVLLVMFMALIGIAAVACGGKPKGPAEDGEEVGAYYYDADDGEYVITLNSGNKFAFWVKGVNKSGTYQLTDEAIVFTFDGEEEGLAATLKDGVLTLNYENAELRFLIRTTYTITFNANGGSAVGAVSVVNGRTVAKPEDPKRSGYVFIGWYTDAEFTTPFLFGTQTVTSDLTLYAQWGAKVPGQSEFIVDYVLGYEGAESFADQETIGGRLYEVPVPASRAGYTFKGWWISMYDDADKLSYPYTSDFVFKASTTLYALWEENRTDSKLSAPVVTVESGAIRWDGISGASSYKVEIDGPESFTAVSTTTGSTTMNVPFASSPAGDYVVKVTAVASSESNNSETTVRYYKNKALDNVSLFSVAETSVLIFNEVANAEKYLITIDCGNDEHTHTLFDNGKSTNYNFANCAMQEGGIRFTVTAVAKGYASSTSKVFVYNRLLSEVTGFSYDETTGILVWDAVKNATNYIVSVSDGNPAHTGEAIDIGNNTSYSLKEYEGEIVVNVYPKTRGYNSPAASTFTYTKTALATPGEVDITGSLLTWAAVNGATSYEIEIGNSIFTSDTNSFDLSETSVVWEDSADYQIRIRAKGDSEETVSLWTDAVDTRYYEMYATLSYAQSVVSWRYVIGATAYDVKVNDGEAIRVEGANRAEVILTKEGINKISVRFYDGRDEENEYYSDWATIEVYAHAITLDSRGGSAVPTQYRAIGDKVLLPAPEKTGYDFVAWYNTPDGAASNGAKYEDDFFCESGEIVLYAYYTPKAYTVTLDLGNGDANETATVYYERNYTLSVPENTDQTRAFGGWFSLPNGVGTQYTDENGESIDVWNIADNATVYPFWKTLVLDFELSYLPGNPEQVYAVSKGSRISMVSTVTVPETYRGIPVKIVMSGAFKSCTTLVSINIPNTVQLIGTANTFTGCTKLEAINITEVEGNKMVRYWSHEGVLYDYGDIDSQPEDKTQLKSTLFVVPVGKTGSYTMPATGVSEIPTEGFASSKLSEVVIPASVSRIGTRAFYSCTNLTSVQFAAPAEGQTAPDLTVEARAFYMCSYLVSITFPARLKDIDLNRYTLTAYTSVPVYHSVTYTSTSIEVSDAFLSCTRLQEINVEEGGAYYGSVNGMLTDATKKTLYYCPKANPNVVGDFTVPSGITTIADGAFLNITTITSLTIPNSVTSIGECSFYYDTAITTITFQGNGFSNVTIGRYAFRQCTALVDLVFEEGSKVATIGEYAFYSCTKLETLNVPKSMTKICDQAFRSCTALTTVNFDPDGQPLEFGENVFYSCTKITSLHLTKNIKDAGGLFGGLNYLASVTVDEDSPYYANDEEGVLFDKDKTQILFYPSGRGGNYVIPDTVLLIGSGVFKGNTSLTEITIGKNVTKIGDEAFYNCTNLSKITFAEGGTEPLEIGSKAFYYTAVTTLTLPERVRELGPYALYYVRYLEELNLNEGLESIGDYAIYYTKLTSLEIPSTVKKIGYKGVAYNSSLTNLTFAENSQLEEIGEAAFYYFKFTSIVIPKSVKTIGQLAFCYGGTTTSTTVGSLTSVIFEEGSQLETIGAYAFRYNKNLKEITIPKSVKRIDPYAFCYCGLTKVEFEKGGTEDLTLGSWISYKALPTSTTNSYAYGYVFYGCDDLETVNFPARLTELGQYTFSGCENLKTVTFGEGEEEASRLSNIGNHAFYNCTALESITIPASVKNLSIVNNPEQTTTTYDFNRQGIGEYAFAGCSNLKTVNFELGASESMRETLTFGIGAFQDCVALESITIPARLATYTDKEGNILQPFDAAVVFSGCLALANINIESGDTYYASDDGIVYSADYKQLIYCPSAKTGTITVRGSVTLIGDQAFANCGGLTAIEFEGGEEEMIIGDYAFFGCSSLTSIVLPSNAVSFGAGAFHNCSNLESVTLSKALTAFDATAFTGCEKLNNIFVESGSTTYSSIDGILFSADQKTIYYYPATRTATSYTLPDGVTTIGEGAFYQNAALETVKLPAGLKVISLRAFENCDALTSIKIPNTVTLIDDNAFYGCDSLSNVTFETGGDAALTLGTGALGTSTTTTAVGYKASYVFGYCPTLGSITLPERVQTIGNAAFAYSGVTRVDLPATLKTLGQYAFYHCEEMTEVTFASGCTLTSLPICVFAYSGIESITIPKSVKTISATTAATSPFYYCESLKTVNFEEDSALTTLAYAFYYATGLTSITLPESLTAIGNYVFSYCTSLTNVTLPSKLKTIGTNVFYHCESLKNITLPETVTSLGNYAFGYCYSLESMTVPKSVTTLGTYTFYYCTAIKSISFPETTLTTFPNYTFGYCSSLEEFTVPSTITTLGTYVFYHCESLKTINFPDTQITTFPNYTFEYCASLESFKIPASVTSLGTYVFAYCTSLTEVDFSAATGITEIPTYAFQYCYGLTSFTVPDTITEIGKYAFSYTENLAEVFLGKNVAILGNYAFSYSGLQRITLPASITSLGTFLFNYCESLTSVTMNAQIDYLPHRMFYHCASLENFTIPATVQRIGVGVFAYSGIKNLVIPSGVTILPYEMCYHAEALESVVIPDTVTTIGSGSSTTGANGSVSAPTATTVADVFSYCLSLKSIEVPDSVTLMTPYTFRYDESLESVKLPSNKDFTAIPKYTFQYCSSLSNVTIPDTIETFGTYVFTHSGITSIRIPEAVQTLPNNTFQGCERLTSVQFPSKLASIGNYAFDGCVLLSNVAIPETVTSIGTYAFRSTAIKKIDIPSTITTLPTYVFAGCADLAEVNMSDSVETIGAGAFADCVSLTSVELPSALSAISGTSFAGCTGITAFSISDMNGSYATDDGVIYTKDMSTLVAVPSGKTGTYNVPATLKLSSYAFAGSSFSEVTIADGVEIPTYLFYNSLVQKVTLPSDLTEIPNYTFYGCENLTEVTIPSGVTTIGTYAFAYSGLVSVTISKDITSIGTYAFAYTDFLGNVTFEAGGTEALVFGSSAFRYNTALTSITIPARVRSYLNGSTVVHGFGTYCFNNCTALQHIYFEAVPETAEGEEEPAYKAMSLTFAMDSFSFTGLISFEFPDYVGFVPNSTVTPLGSYLFDGCEFLESVEFNFPEDAEQFTFGSYSFRNCTSLKTFVFPAAARGIGSYMFDGAGLEEIVIPETITNMTTSTTGYYAFRNCVNLTTVTIRATTTTATSYVYIPTSFFEGCTALTTVNFETEKLKYIYTNSFKDCTAIKEIVIPATVTSITANAFTGWTAEQTIRILGTVKPSLTNCEANIVYGAA